MCGGVVLCLCHLSSKSSWLLLPPQPPSPPPPSGLPPSAACPSSVQSVVSCSFFLFSLSLFSLLVCVIAVVNCVCGRDCVAPDSIPVLYHFPSLFLAFHLVTTTTLYHHYTHPLHSLQAPLSFSLSFSLLPLHASSSSSPFLFPSSLPPSCADLPDHPK